MSSIKSKNCPLIVVLGPTACGKTKLAVQLARRFGGEIISADSRQVYTGMDIGTGKDLEEYGETPYHLIDIVDPMQEYNVFQFANDFCSALTDIANRERTAILAGGTGMYLDAVLNRYPFDRIDQDNLPNLENKSDEELISLLRKLTPNQHNTTDLKDRERTIQAIQVAMASEPMHWPTFSEIVLGMRCDRQILKDRITYRLKQRLDSGLINEVEALHESGLSWDKLHFFGLEYRFIALYLKGELNYNDMYQKLNAAIHYFSKQQSKWFQKMERKGIEINWLDMESQTPVVEQAIKIIQESKVVEKK